MGEAVSAQVSVGYVVRETHRVLQRMLEERIEPHGVTWGMWWFLLRLWMEDGVTQRKLSELVQVMEPTTVRAIDRMEQRGLVERRKADGDRRSVYIFLTPKGREMADVLLPVAWDVNRIATSDLSDDEEAQLRSLLRRVQRSLDNYGR